jgi:hypothetical protein
VDVKKLMKENTISKFYRFKLTIQTKTLMKTMSRAVLLMAFLIAGTAVGSYAQQEKPKKEEKKKEDKDHKDHKDKKDEKKDHKDKEKKKKD